MPCRTLTPKEVTIVVTPFPEELPVKGNAICSGDEVFDRKVVNGGEKVKRVAV